MTAPEPLDPEATAPAQPEPARPRRIQLRRTRGWRLPPGAVSVARPTRWGNPYVVHQHTDQCGPDHYGPGCPDLPADNAEQAVNRYRHALLYPLVGDPVVPDLEEIHAELAGRDLGCWCADGQPCHGDVLLAIANGWEVR